MNTKRLIIYTFFFLSINLFSQKQISNGEISYEITMKVDKDKLKKLNIDNKISEKAKKNGTFYYERPRKC